MRKIIAIIAVGACVSTFAQNGAKPIPQIVPDDDPQTQSAPMPQFAPAPTGMNQPQAMQNPAVPTGQGQAAAPKPPKFAKLFPEIKGSTGKIGVGFWESNWGWVVALGIVFALALFTIFRKRAKPPLPPVDIALIKINEAKAGEKNLSAKAYAAEVSQAVRDYIDAAHNLPAPERTTQEFLEIAAESEAFDDNARKMLQKILTLSDMAKFAKHSFKSEEKIALADAAIDFVGYDDKKTAEKNAGKKADRDVKSDGVLSDENGLCCSPDDSDKKEDGR